MSEASKDDPSSQPLNSPNLRRLHTKLIKAARVTGILPEDPLYVIITAFVEMLNFMDDVSERSDRSVRESSQRVFDAVARAKTAADAEQQRFETALKATQARTIDNVSQAIAKSAEAALTKHVRTLQWRAGASTAAAFVIVAITSFVGGSLLGSWNTRSALEAQIADFKAISLLSPEELNNWLHLMQLNGSINDRLKHCLQKDGSFKLDGRDACSFTFGSSRFSARHLSRDTVFYQIIKHTSQTARSKSSL